MPPEMEPAVLVDPAGRPLPRRASADTTCPRCRSTKRVGSSGFGMPHAVCASCGFEFHDQPFIAEER